MFNPEWENLPNFKRFIERKEPNEHYPYTDSTNCACAQYLKSEGKYVDGWLSASDPGLKDMSKINVLASGIANWDNAGMNPPDWTFGKLLDRVNTKLKELEPV